MFTDEVSIIGLYELGTWTATKAAVATNEYDATNIYTLSKWGRPAKSGAKITPSVTTIKHEAGDSPGIIGSHVTDYGAQVGIGLLSAHLENVRRSMGLPSSALSGDLSAGTPTAETLVVRGDEIATEEIQLYVKSMGPLGPRTTYFPRAKVANLAELMMARDSYTEPQCTFDLYENQAGELYWHVDAAA